MIRLALNTDRRDLAEMMMELYKEIMPEYASDDIDVYKTEIKRHLHNPLDTIYINPDRGFFIVRDESEPMTPGYTRYNGIRVYIKPQHRHTPLLAKFYKRLFRDFPNGDILGVTEINSPHIAVLDKRHETVAKVYLLKRN